MLEHGGHLIDASKKYNIPLEQWTDLSTGINPNGWPVPKIPEACWQRLPESADGLLNAAKRYYQCQSILAVAGSQAAIQTLPLMRKKSKVGVLAPAYAEHAYSWQKAGHEVIELSADGLESELATLDILILINPNNPTGMQFSKTQLLNWHRQLNRRNGWLIVDEAFIDTMPENSLSSHPATEGLIILRSIGKFFGLAGIRCGFAIAAEDLLSELDERLGPWSISHPSRYIATAALLDTQWQKKMQAELKKQSTRLAFLLKKRGLKVTAQTDLFLWARESNATEIHQCLAQKGILTRLFTKPSSLRFGLPKNESQWEHLDQALENMAANCIE